MKKLKLVIKNCYGIRSMTTTLHFANGRNVAIYASNGTMKSSLAHVLKDARDGNNDKHRDRIFTDEISRHTIQCDGIPISLDGILVFDPDDAMDEVRTSAGILVNKALSDKYGGIIEGLKKGMDHLVVLLNRLSGVAKSDIPGTILKDFCRIDPPENEIYEFMLGHAADDPSESERFEGIKYAQVFNEDTKRVIDSAGFRNLLDKYVERHDRLLQESRFLSGMFDHHAAENVRKSLKKAGFFDARHTIVLNPKAERSDAAEEIRDTKQLEEIIKAELNTIEKELDKDWKAMDALLARTAKLVEFRRLLAENRWLIQRLAYPGSLKRDLWTSYFAAESATIAALCDQYRQDRPRLDRIVEIARSEELEWRSIVAEFTRRFHAPFELEVTNQEDAVLGTRVPALRFTYRERAAGAGERARKKPVRREQLKVVLSDGERRALYILNMLFEVKRQIDSGRETVVAIDDLADSFDYKNKYAIVHYLKEVLDNPNFHMIILTHNFDFLRTVIKRGIVNGKQVRFVDKKPSKTTLLPAKIPDSPLDTFISGLEKPTKLIASIPFARNIVEYTQGTTNADYIELTRLLHWREGTDQITVGELLKILDRVFPKARIAGRHEDLKDGKVFDTIIKAANECLRARTVGALEDKIVLSVATRLLAERLLVDRLLEGRAPQVEDDISIHKWIDERRNALKAKAGDGRIHSLTGEESRELETLDDVALMTPETIHINSFMYEPILDMSSDSLAELYCAVRGLWEGGAA